MSGADVVQLLLGGGAPGVAAPANSDRRSMSTRKRSSRKRKSPQKSRSPSRRRKKSERCKPKNKTSDALSRRSASRAKRKRAPKGAVCSSKGRKFQSPGVTASSGPALRFRPDSPDASSSFSSSSSSFDSDEEDFESNTMVLSEDVGAKHTLKPSSRQYRKGDRAHSRVREQEKTSRGARTTVGDAAVVDVARSSASTSASSSSSFSGADFPRPDSASRRQVVVSDVCEEDAAPHAGHSALTGCTRPRKIDCRRDDSPPLGTPMLRRCSSLSAIDGMLGREDESSDAERTPAVAVSWTRDDPEELKFQRLSAEDAEPEAPAARRVQVMQKPSEQHSSSASSGSNVSTAAQRLRRASFIEATERSEELPCTESEAPAPRQKKKKKKKDRLPVPELVAQQPPSPRTETNLKTTNRIATTVKPRTIATTVAKTPVVSDAQREAMRNYF